MKKQFIVEEIAEWASSINFNNIPENVITLTKLQILNNIAASFAGSFSNGAQGIIDASKKVFAEKGKSTIFTTGEKTSPARALFVNSSLSMTFDYDDYLFLGHTGHSSVFTSLAVGEDTGSNGRDILTASVLANEIAGRLGASVVLGPHNGQLWSFIHSLASACAAGRLLKLTQSQITNAIGIALYQPNFPLFPGFMGPDSKLLTASTPATTGLISAYLAGNGLTGSHSIIEHPRGFFKYFSFEPLKFMLSGLGNSWVTESIAYKIYPGCAYIDTTMDALFKTLDQAENVRGKKVKTEEIKDVHVEANLLTVGMDTISREFINTERIEAININFSIPYNVAIGIIAHRLTPAELKQDELDKNAELIKSLAKRVILKHNPEMTLKVIESFIESGLTSIALSGDGIKKILRLRRKIRDNTGKLIELKISDILPLLIPILRKATKNLINFKSKKKINGLNNISFSKFKLLFPAGVTLRLRDGSEFYSQQEFPFGSICDDEQEKRVQKKFFEEGRRAGIKNLEKLYSIIMEIDKKEAVILW